MIIYVSGKSLFYLELMGIYSMLRRLTLAEELALSSCFPPLCLFPVSSCLSLALLWFLVWEETMSVSSVGNWTAECFLGSGVLVSHPLEALFSPNSIKELVIYEGPDGPNYTNLSVGGWEEEPAIWFEPIVILWKVWSQCGKLVFMKPL